MSAALKKALHRREKLLREIEEIDNFIALYKTFSREVSGTETKKKRGRPRVMLRHIIDVLQEADRPLFRSEIVERLRRKGVVIPGSNPGVYVGTICWRNRDLIKNESSLGYSLLPGAQDASDGEGAGSDIGPSPTFQNGVQP